MHRALDDAGPVPFEWWLSRICEEFSCLPSQAIEEWERAPHGLLEHIVEARAYAAAKDHWERACKHGKGTADVEMTPLMDRVVSIEADLVNEAIEADARKSERDG